jgi:hypothetical protein
MHSSLPPSKWSCYGSYRLATPIPRRRGEKIANHGLELSRPQSQAFVVNANESLAICNLLIAPLDAKLALIADEWPEMVGADDVGLE